jgi:hypothetical protein
MRRIRRALGIACVLAGTVLLLAPAASAAVPPHNPGIVPPQSQPRGATYGEWSARWWQWAYQTRVHDSHGQVKAPFLAGNGTPESPAEVDCSWGQSGGVWFLAGTYQPAFPGGGTTPEFFANRSCTIPSGTALFLPIINSEWDNLNVVGQPPLGFTLAELRAKAAADIDSIQIMSATLDGRSVQGLSRPDSPYRVQSPVFSYTLPADNLPSAAFGTQFAGTTPPPGAVADGVFLMVSPLPIGTHVIHWEGKARPPSGPFQQDITYHITVKAR